MTDLPAASSDFPPSQVPKDTTVDRTSAGVGIIIGALVAFGIISISIFLIYRRSDASVDHLAWSRRRRRRRTAEDQAAIDTDDKASTQAGTSDATSVSLSASDGGSQQNLVPTAPDPHIKQSFLQKIQQTFSKPLQPSAKVDKVIRDMESGNSPESWEDSATGKEGIRTSADEWIGRPIPAANMSLHTRSSMALGGALAPTGSLETTGPRPDLGSISGAMTAQKPVPHSHAMWRENPLPPLPAVGDPRRNTTVAGETEDSDPVRQRSDISSMANIEKGQEKRMHHLPSSLRNRAEIPSVTKLTAPHPVANPNPDALGGHAIGSALFSDMTADLDIQTPALQIATMAWPVHEAAGQVEVPSIPRSTTRGRKPGLGAQNEGWL